MQVISRSEAKAAGLKRYFTGKACKHGHVSERDALKGACLQCKTDWTHKNKEKISQRNKEKYKQKPEIFNQRTKNWASKNRKTCLKLSNAWRKNNPEKIKAQAKARYDKNPEKFREASRLSIEKRKIKGNTYYSLNSEKVKIYGLQYREANKEKRKEITKRWKVKNLDLIAFYVAKYRHNKRKRTPAWANILKIKEIYKNCPEGHEVDHIVPINGKTVSGLHCEANLQYLKGKENASKGNHWWPDMP